MNLRAKTTQSQQAQQAEEPQQPIQPTEAANPGADVGAPPTGLRGATNEKALTQVRTRAEALYWGMSRSNGYSLKGEGAFWAGNPPPAWMHRTIDAVLAKYGLDEASAPQDPDLATHERRTRASSYVREAICQAADAIYMNCRETPEKAVITGVSTKNPPNFEDWVATHPHFARLLEQETGRATNFTREEALESAYYNFRFEVGAHLCAELSEGAGSVNPNIPLDGQGMPKAHTDLGGYPIYYLTKDNGVLSPKAVAENIDLTNDPDDPQWYIVGTDINYEDASLICDHTGERIPSAYAEDEHTKAPEPTAAERLLARAKAAMDRLAAQNVAEWVGLHYSRNYSAESPEKQAEWLERYKDSHFGDDWLDTLVHDLKDRQAATAMNHGPDHKADATWDSHTKEASATNNEGPLAQIEYILTQISPEEAWAAIAEELGVPDDRSAWIYPGAEVFWNDPDEGACSCHATVHKLHGEGPLEDDSVVVLRRQDGTTFEAMAGELS